MKCYADTFNSNLAWNNLTNFAACKSLFITFCDFNDAVKAVSYIARDVKNVTVEPSRKYTSGQLPEAAAKAVAESSNSLPYNAYYSIKDRVHTSHYQSPPRDNILFLFKCEGNFSILLSRHPCDQVTIS